MMKAADFCAVLALCLFQLFLNPLQPFFVLAFLAAFVLLIGDALFAFDAKARLRLVLFAAGMFFVPAFCLFLPAFAYKTAEKAQWGLLVPGFAAGILHLVCKTLSPAAFCLMLLGSAVAVLGAWKSSQAEVLHRQLLKSIDSSRENSLLLEEKNKALREKQDYEIYAATLRERNRIAREIHDNVGHLLSRAILLTGAVRAVSRDEKLQEPLSGLEESLHTAMTGVRSGVHDLHNEAVDLKIAAEEIIDRFTYCETRFQYDMSRSVPVEIKYCFLAVLQEALTNIAKHSGAGLAVIQMQEQPGFYRLSIRDNGKGGSGSGDGIGLSNMKQRAEELGGLFRIHRDRGFEIFITIPRECRG